MTRHNLDLHISWLLSSRADSPAFVNANGAKISTSGSRTLGGRSAEEDRTRGVRPATSSPSKRPRTEQAINVTEESTARTFPPASTSLPQIIASPLEDGSMGKLTSTSRSSRPALISQRQPPTPASTSNSITASASLMQNYTKQLRENNTATPSSKTPRDTSVPRFHRALQTPQTPRQTPRLTIELKPEKVESIDLTKEDYSAAPISRSSSTEIQFGEPKVIWREDAASRAEPLPPKASKKRKSGEMTPGRSKRVNPDKSLVKHGRIHFENMEGFVDVDDVVSRRRQSPQNMPATPGSGITMSSIEEDSKACLFEGELQATETYSRVETGTRTNVSRAPSVTPGNPSGTVFRSPTIEPIQTEAWNPTPQKFVQVAASPASRQIASPISRITRTPDKHQNRQPHKVIQDSDEEEEEEVLSVVGKRISHSPISLKNNLSVTNPTESPKWQDIPTFDAATNKTRDNSTPRTSSPLRPISQNLPMKTDIFSSPTHVHTPAKAPMLPNFQRTPSASLDPDDKKLVSFYLRQPSAIRLYWERVENSVVQNQQAVLKSLDEDQMDLVPQLKEERKALLKMNQAYLDLEMYRKEHCNRISEKKALGHKILELLDLNIDTSPHEERNSKVTAELRNIENRISQLLHVSGAIKDGFGTGVEFESPDIGPTSSLIANDLPPQLNSNTSTIGSAQVILQTQFPSMLQGLSASSHTHTLDNVSLRSPVRREQSAFSVRHQLSPSPVRRAATAMSLTKPQRESYEDWNKSNNQLDAPDFHQRPATKEYGSEFGDDVFAELLLQDAQDTEHNMRTNEDISVPEDYGDSGDDDEMLEFAQEVERRTSHPPVIQNKHTRQALTETPRNTSILRGRSTNKKDMYSHVDADHAKLLRFPWSNDVKKCLKDRFKLKGFRTNQLEAINATLGGEDAFVLMPTGGGKSLCYQLPAIVQSGKTKGVTIVISPLLSLMNDQVDSLRSKDIQAYSWNGETDPEEKKIIKSCLKETYPEQYIQLLYITPEMISKSGQMMDLLSGLHKKKKLARIVIDEAHCVSQWGHDFRPDYVTLGKTREDFPGVPLMALTATATENVKVDIMHNLGMGKCPVFSQSFNRPNLIYEVRPKKGRKQADMIEEIAKMINTKYKRQSGIIYTLSRKGCEDLAASLTKHGINAYHYHASLKAEEKSEIQRDWQSGKLQVVVATIAFGMGIDKPDVRFVVHFMVPKSLEGYYQETGRAGRDGKKSGCYLYYGYPDTAMLKKFIYDSEASDEQKDRQRMMLSNMIGYCENRADCRRMQVLAYFGENFSKEDCNHTCDNCSSGAIFEMEDFTNLSKAALGIVKQVQDKRATLLNCVDLLRGAGTKNLEKLEPKDVTGFGLGKSINRSNLERLFYRLLWENALAEYSIVNRSGFPTQYVALGPNCRDFITGKRKVHLQIQKSSPNVLAAKKRPIKESSLPASTILTSPISAAARRRKPHSKVVEKDEDDYRGTQSSFVVPDDEIDFDEEPAFESMDSRPGLRLGPPITGDHRMTRLPDIHRDVVHEFVSEAKKIEEKLRNRAGARKAFFTETNLQDMAILWTLTIESMEQIPQIDIDRVNQYGKFFLPLIKEFYTRYNDMMSGNTIRDDVDMDDNHRNVIDLISDEEDAMEDGDDDNVPEHQPSPYFPKSATMSSAKSSSSRRPGSTGPTYRSTSGSSKPSRGKSSYRYARGKGRGAKRTAPRKSSGSTSTYSNSGVSKRGGKARGGRSGGAAESIRNFASQGGGSGIGGAGIGMMPT